MAMVKLFIALCIVSVSIGGEPVRAQSAHHVVGGDRGWDPNTDVDSWASGRVFRVGDKIWFAYSAAQENIVELKTSSEYEACDVSNPIRMFTEGLDTVSLEEEGIRYFTSGKPGNCKNGLKLHVDVQSQSKPNNQNNVTSESSVLAVADAPTTPSASTHLNGLSFGLFVGLLVSYLGLRL